MIIKQAKQRRNFYRNIYRGGLTMLLICFFLILALLAINLLYYFTAGPVDYYATSTDGQVYPLAASEQPPPYTDFSEVISYY